jgi:hypothetical protein
MIPEEIVNKEYQQLVNEESPFQWMEPNLANSFTKLDTK